MPPTPFSPVPLDSLILYVLQRTGREFGSIELAKVVFLSDIEAMKFTGKTITGEEYLRAEKGPLVRGFADSIARMLGHEVKLDIKAPWGLNRWGKHCHSLGPDVRFEPSLDDLQRATVERVLRRTSGLSPKVLEQMAYETEPMQAMATIEARSGTAYGSILDFTTVSEDPGMATWRKNKRKRRKLPANYRKFLTKERKEASKLLESLD